ncbi:MAG: hypothetical protein K6L75_07285 [Cellvibrionaceae bacterium]
MHPSIVNRAACKNSKGLSVTVEDKEIKSIKGLIILTTLLLSFSLITHNVDAQQNTIDKNFFLPTDMNFFYSNGNINRFFQTNTNVYHQSFGGANNSLDEQPNQWLANFARVLDNNDLFITAQNLRANDMTSSQRGHNYRWIQKNDLDSPRQSKALIRKIFSSALKAYWNQWRQKSLPENSLIPDADGKGKLQWQQTDIDYRLKISGNYVKLMFKMEFH